MKKFDWNEAQKRELDWWDNSQDKKIPKLGTGGLSRYVEYLKVFGPHFSPVSIADIGGGAFPIVGWIDKCKHKISVDPLNSKFEARGFARDPNIEYIDGLAESLPFEDNSVDQVLLLNMLDHFENWPKAVDEAIRVCRSSVIIHVHIDGPFASDGMHHIIREDELIEHLERKHNGRRLIFNYPPEKRHLIRRCFSEIKLRLTGRGTGFCINHEKCWAGIIKKEQNT